MAVPRCFNPTISIFMITVVDQVNPWLSPRAMFARMMKALSPEFNKMSGACNAMAQPKSRVRLRPISEMRFPVNRLAMALLRPNTPTISRAASVSDTAQDLVSSGRRLRSKPTMAPTKALISTNRPNRPAFSRSPSTMGRVLVIQSFDANAHPCIY